MSNASRTDLFAFARNTVLRAGAGTGKTEALTTLYLHLASGLAAQDVWPRQGLLPERIVALTFTEKAAAEMRDRIAEAVALLSYEPLPDALESEDSFARERAVKQWGQARGLSAAVVQRVRALAESAAANGRALPGPEAWQRVGFALGSARIGTFHGFAAGVLRASAMDLGIDPAFEVIDEEASDRLLREATVGALAHAARHDVSAVADLMALAGGFDADGDRGLVALLGRLVRSLDEAGIEDDDVGLASAVAPSRIETYVAADAVAAFAAACQRVPALRNDGAADRAADLASKLAAIGPVDVVARARACAALLASMPLPPRTRTMKIELAAEDARAAVEGLRDRALGILSEQISAHARGVLLDARRRYREHKIARAGMDFSDLMHRLRDALRDRPAIRRAWKRRFDAVLVDEFQDTNRVQRDLLYLLRESRDAERAGSSIGATDLEPAGLLLVGDAKQSIYAFRGADVSVFFETERQLGEAGGARLELTDSHRSLDALIDAINPATEALLGAGLIAHAESMYDRRRDALTADVAGDGRARVELAFVDGATADELRTLEAQAIARRIVALTSPPAGPEPALGWRAPRFDEIAILVPTWSHLDPIRKSLKDHGVPYALLGGPGFWERREVDDLVVLLRCVGDPSDRLALAAVLRGPLVGLSDAALAHLLARPAALDDVLDPPAPVRLRLEPDDRARLDEARPTLRRMVRFGATLGPCEVLRLALAERSYAAVLATLPFGTQKVANVDKLVGLAAAAERRGGDEATLAGFVRHVDRMRAAAQHETEADVSDVATGAVQILSIHAAKGLEWPVVFVAQTSRRRRTHPERVLLEGGRRVVALPAGFAAPERFREIRRDVHAAEDDDQRRLLYVALTRARDLVVVSGPPHERGEGEWRALSMALLKQAPARVRVLRPGEDGPAVPVRGGVRVEHASVAPAEQLAHAIDPPRIPRRRLVLAPAVLADMEVCPRRYFSRHELGLDEGARTPDAPSPRDRERVLAAVRDLLARVEPAALVDTVRAASSLASIAGSLAREHDAAALALATQRVFAFAGSPLARAWAEPDALVVRSLPLALRVGDGDEAVALHDRADALLHGEAFGRDDAMVVLAWALDDDARDLRDGAEHSLRLGAWCTALERRFAEARVEPAGAPPVVHAAVVYLATTGPRIAWLPLRSTARDAFEPRVARLGHALSEARALGAWQGHARPACERLGCGYVARCHGG